MHAPWLFISNLEPRRVQSPGTPVVADRALQPPRQATSALLTPTITVTPDAVPSSHLTMREMIDPRLVAPRLFGDDDGTSGRFSPRCSQTLA